MDHATARLGVRVNAIVCAFGIAPTAYLLAISEGAKVQNGLALAILGMLGLAARFSRATTAEPARVAHGANAALAATVVGLGATLASCDWDLIAGLFAGFGVLLAVTALIDRTCDGQSDALTGQ